MHKQTLHNTFHNTCCTILVPDTYTTEQLGEYLIDLQDDAWNGQPEIRKRAQRKLSRIHNILCGITGCRCGDGK